jgi:hypothetical protein
MGRLGFLDNLRGFAAFSSNISNCATVLCGAGLERVSRCGDLTHSREACEIAANVFFVFNAIPLEIKFSAAVGLTLAVVIPAACLTFQFVELPGIRLGNAIRASLAREHASRYLTPESLRHDLAGARSKSQTQVRTDAGANSPQPLRRPIGTPCH